MSNYYRTAYHSFFKEHVQSLSKGRFWLDEASDVDLGEPCVLHPTLTGYIGTPIKKRRIKSYDNATPGAEHAIGISLDIREISSGVSNDNIILRPDYYYPREITLMKMGICKMLNKATGYTAQIDEKCLPANGGGYPQGGPGTQSGSGYSLGKWLEETVPGEAGLVFVDPKAEVLP